jgi:hypothetical protein
MPLAAGASAIGAGVAKPPEPCPIPPLQTLVHDDAWFDRVDLNPFHRGLLSPLREFAS